MRSKAVVFVVLVTGLVLAMSGIAAGGDAPAPTVDPASGPPGTSFAVSGVGCFFNPNEVQTGPEVEITVDFPTPLTETTNADVETGEWSVTFTVPEGTPPGPYEVSATCLNTPVDPVEAADFDYPAGAVFTVSAETPVTTVVSGTPTAAAPAPAVAGAPRFTG